MIKFVCNFQNCSKRYITEGGLKKHLRNYHQITVDPAIIQASQVYGNSGDDSIIDSIGNNSSENGEWDRDQINLALQLSMKEHYPDFVPDETVGDKKCVICFTNNATMAFINCGHLVTCEECSRKMMKEYNNKKRCPVCRKPILKLLKIYF